MDEDPLIAEDIASCLMCNTTFETSEECFVHTCAQIKTESNELDNEEQTNSFDQENFKSDMNPDFLEHNLIYGLKRNRQEKNDMIESKDVSDEDSDYGPTKKNCGKQKNKKPRIEEEEWLTAYKSQCKVKGHKTAEMAELIGMNVDTFRSKIF